MNDMIKALFANPPEQAKVSPPEEKPAREAVPVIDIPPAPVDPQAARTGQWFLDLRHTMLIMADEVKKSKGREHKAFIRPQLNLAADAAITLRNALLELSDK